MVVQKKRERPEQRTALGPRMRQALQRCIGRLDDVELVTCSGRMGSDWCHLNTRLCLNSRPHLSRTTQLAVKALCEYGIELLLYAGGDGTTRDIVEALNNPDFPRHWRSRWCQDAQWMFCRFTECSCRGFALLAGWGLASRKDRSNGFG